MVNVIGVDIPVPSIELGGFLSNSWVYLIIIGLIGFIAIIGISVMLFFMTYKKKIIFFENVSGQGWVPTIKTRARVIKLGRSGQEILKALKGGIYVSAYGRKMGKNSYWYAKGEDGYWYNIILGDLDAKFGILDIEPVDRDVRMFHLGIDKVAQSDYVQKKGFIEKYGALMVILLFFIAALVAMVIIAGSIKEGIDSLNNPETAKINQETAELLNNILNKIDVVDRRTESGLVSGSETGGG